jgi:seryl-tRNA synthetase
MLDIRVLRDLPDEVRQRLRTRGGDHWRLIDELLACDEIRRRSETAKQELQAERKRASKEIGALIAHGQDPEQAKAAVKELGERIAELDRASEAATARQEELLLNIPNLPHPACPVGSDESANPVVRTWGDQPPIQTPKDHLALAEALGLISLEDAARIAGSGFAVYRGQGARLERALITYLLDMQSGAHGYEEVNVPHLVRRECMEGTGQLPKFEDDMYGTEPGEDGRNSLFLAPTAEVPVTNLYRDTILAENDLPVRMVAYTPCFRREAGSAGKDNRGIIRMHQFDKVELVQIVHPDRSFEVLEELTGHAEAALRGLGLHYRVIELCTGDLGFSAAKTYDLEVWAPGQGRYLEVSSCSCFTDYQARRMKLRFKDADGRNRFCHTLNGSGTALPRLYVALLEQCQQPDGSIRLPAALAPYFGAGVIG